MKAARFELIVYRWICCPVNGAQLFVITVKNNFWAVKMKCNWLVLVYMIWEYATAFWFV